jgi:hypothetical protein
MPPFDFRLVLFNIFLHFLQIGFVLKSCEWAAGSSLLLTSTVRTQGESFALFHGRKGDKRENDTSLMLVICSIFVLAVFISFETNAGNL